MYLKQIYNKKADRIFLSIVHGYRDPETKNVKQKTIQSLGYLDELQKEYADPIAHFKEVAKEMTRKEKEQPRPRHLTIEPNELIQKNKPLRKNIGFTALTKIFYSLDLDSFFLNRQRSLKMDYSLMDVVRLLVLLRILRPCSKKATFEAKSFSFDSFNCELPDMYHSLDYLNRYKDDLIVHLHERMVADYNRKLDYVFYDVTNYYFESETDAFRRKGVSKEHRPNPIVQMGLLMDNKGLPITYQLFPGNTTDCSTLMPVFSRLRKQFNLGKIIVVADKGLNTSNNVGYQLLQKNGYIYSKSVRAATNEFKAYVLNESDYVSQSSNYKRKSRIADRVLTIENEEGAKKKVEITEKQVVFYSEKYAKKARYERNKAIEKALRLIDSPQKHSQATAKGVTKYIEQIQFDKKTGEILTPKSQLTLDWEKIEEEAKYDGFYAIVTSELKMKDNEIIDTYRGLWKIEETFKITKSELEGRPVYVSKKEHIEAHFLVCFIALLILRILEHKTQHQFSTRRLIEALTNMSGTYLDENYYLFDYRDDVTEAIGKSLDLNYTQRFMTVQDIRHLVAKTKK